MRVVTKSIILTALFTFISCSQPQKPDLRIAVAANFYIVLESLINDFETEQQIKTQLISGATGQLFEQIKKGLPVDVFLAADTARPQQLVNQKLAQNAVIYAKGVLVMWSDAEDSIQQQWLNGAINTLAMANPELAPYGFAARNWLNQQSIEPKRIVTASNVVQVRQLVENGADAGLMAWSTAKQLKGNYWKIPGYSAIEQQAVIVNSTEQPELARAFTHWLQSEKIQRQIRQRGYQ